MKQNSSSESTAEKNRRKAGLKARVATGEQLLNALKEKGAKKNTKKIGFAADDNNDKDYDG